MPFPFLLCLVPKIVLGLDDADSMASAAHNDGMTYSTETLCVGFLATIRRR